MLNLLRALTISATILVGCQGNNKNNPVNQNKAEDRVSQIQLIDLNNKAMRLDEYKGKTIFINFWASWCKPCVEEMPSIEKAQAMINDKEVVFLLASSESIEEIREFKNNHSYQFTYVHVKSPEILNLQALPTTFIINSKGKLVFSEMGTRNWNESSNINLIKSITKQHE
ncbi:MAG: TlpA disulfide reductase family protein [Bacteroidota bacterium]